MSASKAERQASAHTTTAEHERASPEKSEASARLPHFRVIIDQASVTPEVLHHKYRGQGTVESPYLVEFLSRDARDARKWSALKKWTITLTQATATLAVSFSSSAYSGGMLDVQKEFQIPRIEAVLGVSLFVLGFAVGPLLWAPFSELYGRQLLFFMTYMALTAFNAAAAGAQNMTTLAIMRFFAGAFGSSPLTNAGGVIADLFDASERGFAMPAFSMAPFLGPALGKLTSYLTLKGLFQPLTCVGPIAGGFLTDSEGWRWVQGMVAIFTGLLWIAGALVCPETYQPVLLRRRAERLSKMTGKVYISKLDEGKKDLGLVPQLKIALSRPWIMLIKEPIVLFISIYMAIIYGTLFMCFAAFPIVYGETRGWSAGFSGLAFCGIVVGTVISVGWSLYDNKRYKKAAEAAGGHAAPEVRLPPAIIGSILIPVGEFWFAWTNGPQTHWLVSIVGTGIFSAGIVLVFLSLMNYLIDSCKLSSLVPLWEVRKMVVLTRLCRRDIRCFSACGQLCAAGPLRHGVPALHVVHVQGPGDPLGQQHPGLLGPGVRAFPILLLEVRGEDSPALPVCGRGGQGAGQDAGTGRRGWHGREGKQR
jgi:MFS family permease